MLVSSEKSGLSALFSGTSPAVIMFSKNLLSSSVSLKSFEAPSFLPFSVSSPFFAMEKKFFNDDVFSDSFTAISPPHVHVRPTILSRSIHVLQVPYDEPEKTQMNIWSG